MQEGPSTLRVWLWILGQAWVGCCRQQAERYRAYCRPLLEAAVARLRVCTRRLLEILKILKGWASFGAFVVYFVLWDICLSLKARLAPRHR